MKLPITDQFLLDVYSILEKGGDVAHFLFRRRITMWDITQDPNDPKIKRYVKDLSRQQFNKLIYHLKKNNWIKVSNLKGNKALVLTKEGIDKAIKARFKISDSNRVKRKDKKWIMILFDIPEKEKSKRELLRSLLKNLGYRMFQKSVWITPYDVLENTEKRLQFHLIDKYVRLFLIEEIK